MNDQPFKQYWIVGHPDDSSQYEPRFYTSNPGARYKPLHVIDFRAYKDSLEKIIYLTDQLNKARKMIK